MNQERSDSGTTHALQGRSNQVHGVRRWLYVTVGGVFVFLGAFGVVLPGIPTTPFLILASYFFVRSSPRLHHKLMQSSILGPILQNWQEHRALRPVTKFVSLFATTLLILLSLLFGGLPLIVRLVVGLAGLYGIWFVWRLPVIRDKNSQ